MTWRTAVCRSISAWSNQGSVICLNCLFFLNTHLRIQRFGNHFAGQMAALHPLPSLKTKVKPKFKVSPISIVDLTKGLVCSDELMLDYLDIDLDNIKYWAEGVLLTIISVFGITTNAIRSVFQLDKRKGSKKLSFCHKLKLSNAYIFATWWCKLFII